MTQRIVTPPNINGAFQEPYTPTIGRITSASLASSNQGVAPKLECAKFILSASANVTFVDYAGNVVSTFALPQGLYNFPVKEIRVVSSGTVLIVHDGLLAQTEAA